MIDLITRLRDIARHEAERTSRYLEVREHELPNSVGPETRIEREAAEKLAAKDALIESAYREGFCACHGGKRSGNGLQFDMDDSWEASMTRAGLQKEDDNG